MIPTDAKMAVVLTPLEEEVETSLMLPAPEVRPTNGVALLFDVDDVVDDSVLPPNEKVTGVELLVMVELTEEEIDVETAKGLLVGREEMNVETEAERVVVGVKEENDLNVDVFVSKVVVTEGVVVVLCVVDVSEVEEEEEAAVVVVVVVVCAVETGVVLLVEEAVVVLAVEIVAVEDEKGLVLACVED